MIQRGKQIIENIGKSGNKEEQEKQGKRRKGQCGKGTKKESPHWKTNEETPNKTAATYSPTLRCSTIGACGLNFSVRDGKRWSPAAVAT